jgi:hypothetical protein
MRDYTENHDSLAIDTDTARKSQGHMLDPCKSYMKLLPWQSLEN